MKNNFAPIAIFAYKRLDTLKMSIQALQKCHLAENSQLYIFSDAAKNKEDIADVLAVREYVKSIHGFKNIKYIFSESNKGLANSIIDGVTVILEENEAIIVLEDDLVVSQNFLQYMNGALQFYKDNSKVFSISGYTVPIKKPNDHSYDNYFTLRGSSWGWSTWSDRWMEVDWEVKDYADFENDKERKRKFNQMGSDMCKMLSEQMSGKINSWAIRWCYHQFSIQSVTVFPLISKVANIGFGMEATHTVNNDDRFKTPLDTSGKDQFVFDPNPKLETKFIKQFASKYSIKTRAYYKIKNLLRF